MRHKDLQKQGIENMDGQLRKVAGHCQARGIDWAAGGKAGRPGKPCGDQGPRPVARASPVIKARTRT
jgi:hypothetical protein